MIRAFQFIYVSGRSLISQIGQIVSSVYCLSVLMSLISRCMAQVAVGIGSVAFLQS